MQGRRRVLLLVAGQGQSPPRHFLVRQLGLAEGGGCPERGPTSQQLGDGANNSLDCTLVSQNEALGTGDLSLP